MDLLWFLFSLHTHYSIDLIHVLLCDHDIWYALIQLSYHRCSCPCDVHLDSMYVIKILMSQEINIWNVAINFTINYNLFLQLMGDYFTPESCIFFFIHFSKQLFNSKSNQENIIQQPELRNRKLIAHYFFAFYVCFQNFLPRKFIFQVIFG